MTKSSKTSVATENFVYRVVGDSEKRLEKKFDQAEVLAEKRFDKMMTQLDSIAGLVKKFDEEETMQSGRIKIHSDQIEELQNAVFLNA
ncbi:MAG: hypothetical protein AAB625_03075 [Patescibacteria group bacterium]